MYKLHVAQTLSASTDKAVKAIHLKTATGERRADLGADVTFTKNLLGSMNCQRLRSQINGYGSIRSSSIFHKLLDISVTNTTLFFPQAHFTYITPSVA